MRYDQRDRWESIKPTIRAHSSQPEFDNIRVGQSAAREQFCHFMRQSDAWQTIRAKTAGSLATFGGLADLSLEQIDELSS